MVNFGPFCQFRLSILNFTDLHFLNIREVIGRNYDATMTARTLKESIERKQLEFFEKSVEMCEKKKELIELNKRKAELEIRLLERQVQDLGL